MSCPPAELTDSQEDRWRFNRVDLLVLGLFTLIILWNVSGIIAGARDPFIVTLKNYEPWKSALPADEVVRPQFALDDPVSQTYSWIVYAHDRLRNGDFPLWNFRTFSGSPFPANRHTGLFNPLVLIPVWLFPPRVALTIFYAGHHLLAGWFMYLFLKSLRVRRPAALFGGIAYILQGAYLPWEEIFIADNAYFLMTLYYTERVCQIGDRRGVIGFIVSFALLAITGYPQRIVFIMYLISGWVLFTYGPGARSAFLRMGGLIIMFAVSGLLGAMQHLPMLEFYHISYRTHPEFQAVFQSLVDAEKYDSPLALLATGFPRLCGDYLSDPLLGLPRNAVALRNHAYIGVLSAFGAIFAPIVWRNIRARFFTVVFLFGWLLISSNAFYLAVSKIIPGFRFSQGKPYFFCTTAMIIVSAFVLDHVLRRLREDPRLLRKLTWFCVLLLGTLLGLTAVYLQGISLPMLFPSAYRTALGWVIAGLVVVVLAAMMLIRFGRNRMGPWVVVAIIALELIDLVPYHVHFNPLVPRGRAAFPTPAIEFLQERMVSEGPFRIFRDRLTVLRPNSLMLFGLDDMGGFDSVISADYGDLFRSIDPSMIRDSRYIDMPTHVETLREPFWSFLGVRYLVSARPIQGLPSMWKEAWKGEVCIYENTSWQSRWFLVPNIVPVDTVEEGYAEARKIDPRAEAVVVGIDRPAIPDSLRRPPTDGNEHASSKSGSGGAVEADYYGSNELRLRVRSDEDSYLVFSDTWFPGWRAWVDGAETTVYRTDGVVKGVVVPAGEHGVRFLYDPLSYKLGWLLFGVGVVVGWIALGPVRAMFADRKSAPPFG